MEAHILQPYAKSDWPLIEHFRRRWPQATVHAGSMPSLRYRTKIGFLMQLPALFTFGLRIGLAALGGGQAPKAFITHTDFEVLGLALAQAIRRKRVPIFLVGFIYTRRKSRLLSWLRRLYFRAVLGLCQGIVCHSTLETERYAKLFDLPLERFGVVPFALNVERPDTLEVREGGYALSAGRAERDYGLLSRAWTGMHMDLHIVCDTGAPLQAVVHSPRIRLLRECFGADFLSEIAQANFVVVPLKDPELSAGQMVLLQSMSVGKPVIISRTPTTEEYGEHMKTLYFVEYGSETALRDAILRLAGDSTLRARIGAAARNHYEARHTVSAYTNGVLTAVERMLAAPSP
jgi:glycosyltransferase involved in cell wall biosynthesis